MELALLLADGRFPGGGHAHAGGLEPAIADGSVHDLASLRAYLQGRLHTVGALDAWAAASACAAPTGRLPALDAEVDARTWSPAARTASRSLGRGLRRTAARLWPAAAGIPAEHQAVVLGAVAALAGLSPTDAARVSLHHNLVGVAYAAPKLLAVDTADALALAAALAGDCDALAAGALADGPPPWSGPLTDARTEDHATWEVRLFAS